MNKNTENALANSVEFEFVKGHIAATMALIHGLMDQGLIDREHLDVFFANFIRELPHKRETFGLRLILEEWREGLREGGCDKKMKHQLYQLANSGPLN